jgi:amino acid transporter
MASVLLVFQMGQPRIWMSMSRDGLLPRRFARVHPKYKTPSFSTIVVGFVVAVPALFMNLQDVTDLCSIGTLFAFVLVCAGVLVLQDRKDIPRGKFKTPYINAKYIMPLLLALSIVLSFTINKEATMAFLYNEKQLNKPEVILTSLNPTQIQEVKDHLKVNDSVGFAAADEDTQTYLGSLDEARYAATIAALPVSDEVRYETGLSLFQHKIPMWIFILVTIGLSVWAFRKNLSLIPLLGLVSCLYMMAELNVRNWIGFGAWLVLGLIVYFLYGYWNSKLQKKIAADTTL